MSAFRYRVDDSGLSVDIHQHDDGDDAEFSGEVVARETGDCTIWLEWRKYIHPKRGETMSRSATVYLTPEGLRALHERVGEMIQMLPS